MCHHGENNPQAAPMSLFYRKTGTIESNLVNVITKLLFYLSGKCRKYWLCNLAQNLRKKYAKAGTGMALIPDGNGRINKFAK
jgi:hypothetical protein